MLDPNARLVYLDELCPPDDYFLDCAIATTYSLDLLSLLMAPLAMALQDCRSQEAALADPIAVLEALQRTTGRFAVFCQQGRIPVPSTDSLLYSYLEKVVVEVRAPHKRGAFHPKCWVLRFGSEDEELPVLYRFLCLSRNLTFDRSWDTVLTLDGELAGGRSRVVSRNRPLSDFIAALPGLAVQPVGAHVAEHVALMAEEVLRVHFEPPERFDDHIAFVPLGIPGYADALEIDPEDRLLVVSPFLSAGALRPLAEGGEENVLITRQNSLDELGEAARTAIADNADIYYLDDAAERPSDLVADQDEAHETPEVNDLSGLHAKLYVSESGAWATLLTGSANATSAGWGGRNVEFLVELVAHRSVAGIDAILGNEGAAVSLRSLLRPYQPPEEPIDVDHVQKELEHDLEIAREMVAGLGLSAVVSSSLGETFDLVLSASKAAPELPATVCGRCFPITLRESHALDVTPLANGGALAFRGLSLVGLTSFVAFTLSAAREGKKACLSFVLCVPVTGMPSERDKRILHDIIGNRQQFLRYLLFILAGDDLPIPRQDISVSGDGSGPVSDGRLRGIPLLEELLRAFSRRPDKIDRIDHFVKGLLEAGQEEELLPEGFLDVWRVILAAREQGGAR